MALDLLMTTGGIAIVLLGGYLLVASAVTVALGFGLSRAVVGATVVAFGTSAPELTVGLSAVLRGSDGVTVGDVMGSCIGNVGLVLGLAAVINPSVLFTRLRSTAVPVLMAANVLFLAVAAGGRIARWEGGVLLAGLVAVTVLSPRLFPEFGRAAEVSEAPERPSVTARDWAALGGAVVALAAGAYLAVEGAVGVAETLGLSEVAIGVVVIAIGTSLPEVITSVVAAVRGEVEIAVSNVLGSNIFNLLGVMGVVGLVGSIEVDPGVFRVEAPALVISTLALIGRETSRIGLGTAVKLYPAGATTNSASGVRDFDKVRPVLERMAEIGMPLCVHGEVTAAEVDIFDREAVFIDKVLDPIRKATPGLRVVMEHITTSNGVNYVSSGGDDIAGTITTHHLIINRNDILVGGIHPHYYCLPVAKRESHRLALRHAATSGDASFFLGTDSAPHLTRLKEHACGCAGVFSATNTMSCLAEVFEQDGALDRLEAFTSLNGPAFYRLAPNDATVTLTRGEPVAYPAMIETADGPVTVFDPGFPLHWRVSA